MKTTTYEEAKERARQYVEEHSEYPPEAQWSAFDTVKYGSKEGDTWEITDNLDEVPIQGPVRITGKTDSYWGKGKDFVSPVLESPSWLDLLVQANNMMPVTRDMHHCSLERIRTIRTEQGVQIAKFSMGS